MKDKHWTITYDHLEKTKGSHPPPEHTILFKLYDDDNVLYFTGKMSKQLYDSHMILDPLDWAMNHSGCTGMKVNGPREHGLTWV